MYTLIVNIYKYDQFKWQEQVLLDAQTKAEAKQKAMLIPNSTRWAMDLTPRPDYVQSKCRKILCNQFYCLCKSTSLHSARCNKQQNLHYIPKNTTIPTPNWCMPTNAPNSGNSIPNLLMSKVCSTRSPIPTNAKERDNETSRTEQVDSRQWRQ